MINGSNMNLMGFREPVYGTVTMAEVEEKLTKMAKEFGVEVEFYQSNHEGDIVDKMQEVRGKVDGIFINPAAFTYTSVAIRDAICACKHRVVEVHVSNIHAREEFRHNSMLAPVCIGQFVGLGAKGYELALRYFCETDQEAEKNTK